MIESTATKLVGEFYRMSPDGWWVSVHGYRSTWKRRWWQRKPRLLTDRTRRVELTERRWFPIEQAGTRIVGTDPSMQLRFVDAVPGIYDRLALYSDLGELLDMGPITSVSLAGRYRDRRKKGKGDVVVITINDWQIK